MCAVKCLFRSICRLQEVKGSAVAKRGSLELCMECWRSDSSSHSHALLTASSPFIYFFFFFMCMV